MCVCMCPNEQFTDMDTERWNLFHAYYNLDITFVAYCLSDSFDPTTWSQKNAKTNSIVFNQLNQFVWQQN